MTIHTSIQFRPQVQTRPRRIDPVPPARVQRPRSSRSRVLVLEERQQGGQAAGEGFPEVLGGEVSRIENESKMSMTQDHVNMVLDAPLITAP